MATVTVTTTYLEIPGRAAFRPARSDAPDLLTLEAREPLPDFYRFLYGTAGRDYAWTDRLSWSDERLHSYLAQPAVTLLVLYLRGTPAGYVELNRAAPEPGTEVAYFGLFAAFHGRGLGKHLLTEGVQRAYDDGAERVWVHTCTLDGPHAMANYRARGFVPYRTTTHEQELG
jgi:GNAT superfamily N-acetyltransferase